MALEPSPQALSSLLTLGAPSSSGAPATRSVGEVARPAGHLEPARLLSSLHEISWGTTSLPRAPPLIIGGEWLKSIFGSSSGGGSVPGWVPCGARPAIVGAPAHYPLPRGGEPLQGPPLTLMAEDDVDGVLKHARERSAIRREFL